MVGWGYLCIAQLACGGQLDADTEVRQFHAFQLKNLPTSEVRSAAAIFPDDALLGLDIKNAFGAVQWADALLAAVAKAPCLAIPMSMLWLMLCRSPISCFCASSQVAICC